MEPVPKQMPEEFPTKSHYGKLCVLEIPYLNFAQETCMGTMCVHEEIGSAVQALFAELYRIKFPIFSMQCSPWEKRPPQWFLFMNTIGYVDKKRTGKASLSHHAAGLAFDLNPHFNPLIWPERSIHIPPNSVYNPAAAGTVTKEIADICYKHGFLWGGVWHEKKDYMHFSWAESDKLVPELKPENAGAQFA
ncbi:MAG: M15 family metallopeptidase [Alphaproteobacteria bacterium]|nr:M15 family metallopeptidase [Alphaproteobacteria bacterium]